MSGNLFDRLAARSRAGEVDSPPNDGVVEALRAAAEHLTAPAAEVDAFTTDAAERVEETTLAPRVVPTQRVELSGRALSVAEPRVAGQRDPEPRDAPPLRPAAATDGTRVVSYDGLRASPRPENLEPGRENLRVAQGSHRARPSTIPAAPARPPVLPVQRARAVDVAKPAPAARRDQPPVESVVRVTIGRIDVKAIPGAAPARQPALARRESRTLAEYLKGEAQR